MSRDHNETIRRLRYGDIRKLVRDRCGYRLPDDDAGREYLDDLLLAISVGPHADIKMRNAIGIWAPWMSEAEATQRIDRINQIPFGQRIHMLDGEELGQRLNLTNAERERLRLRMIWPHDMTRAEMLELRKAKRRAQQRARMARLRELRGVKPREQWLNENNKSRERPWEKEGISKRTWYRRQAKNLPNDWRRNAKTPAERLNPEPDGTGPSTNNAFLKAAHTPVPRHKLNRCKMLSMHALSWAEITKPKPRKREVSEGIHLTV